MFTDFLSNLGNFLTDFLGSTRNPRFFWAAISMKYRIVFI